MLRKWNYSPYFLFYYSRSKQSLYSDTNEVPFSNSESKQLKVHYELFNEHNTKHTQIKYSMGTHKIKMGSYLSALVHYQRNRERKDAIE
jgi:competence transcription factor ComK